MVAHEDDLVERMIVMMSLTLMYGFIKKWWSTVVNVVLEKKKDAQKIHQLQTIGILEAAFNTALKILFTKKLMSHAECMGLYEEQWGYRQARTFTGPSLRKMTSFQFWLLHEYDHCSFPLRSDCLFVDGIWSAVTNI